MTIDGLINQLKVTKCVFCMQYKENCDVCPMGDDEICMFDIGIERLLHE